MEKLVRHGKSLKLHLQVNKMIQKIIVIIHEMPNYQVLKLNHDLTLYVLNLLVSMVKSKKIDISAVCAQILTDVFNLNTDEKENIDKQISFLISSGAVKKVSNISLLYDKLKTCTLFFLENK